MKTKRSQKHDKGFVFLSVFLVTVYAFTMVINALAGDAGVKIGWFKNGTGEVSDANYLEITPIGWTFSIWGIIYTWLILGIVYILVSICRQNQSGPVYLNPPIITKVFLALYIFNLSLNITWLFLWDRQYMSGALVVFLAYDFSLYLMLFNNHRMVDRYMKTLQQNHRKILMLNRVLIQNGLACLGTWITIATLINLGVVMTYTAGTDQSVASTVSLAILTCEVVAFFILETFVWERYLRYTFSVWPVVIWALCGSMAANWDPEETNSIYSAVLLALAFIFCIIKVVLSILRSRTSLLS